MKDKNMKDKNMKDKNMKGKNMKGKKMKKRILAILLLVLVFTITACGKKADKNAGDGTGKSEASDVKIGIITDTGGVNDASFNQYSWEGLSRAGKDLGITVKYLESAADSDYAPNIETFIDEDYDLIICAGYPLADPLREKATENPDMKFAIIDDASLADVEILKVLYRGAELLILDEPTASLTPQEITELMEIIRNLTADGKSVIIITHKLKEIKAAADYCTVIRQGKYIDTVKVDQCDEKDLAALMVGRDVSFNVDKSKMQAGEIVIEVKDLKAKDYRGVNVLNGLNLSVRRGEIVGLAGVDGNGQSELVEILTGLRKADSGEVLLNGENVFNASAGELFNKGVTSIPEDRQKHGLILDFTVAENLVIQNIAKSPFSEKGVLQRKAIMEHAIDLRNKFDIRPEGCENRPAGQLSGGNQQKIIIAREVTNDADFLIAMNPTRGLDVGAIEFVHKYLVHQRNKNKAILLVSFELDEIMDLSDRIEIIFDGKISGSVVQDEFDEKQLGFMMA